MVGTAMQAPVDISYLADTVILLRYYEALGHVKKAISVVKRRTGDHEATIREYTLSASGMEVGQPLKNFQGVLTGVPQILSMEGTLARE
jgi:circadian clock protein KaiC